MSGRSKFYYKSKEHGFIVLNCHFGLIWAVKTISTEKKSLEAFPGKASRALFSQYYLFKRIRILRKSHIFESSKLGQLVILAAVFERLLADFHAFLIENIVILQQKNSFEEL